MQILIRWVLTAVALFATVWLLSALGWARIEGGPWYGWLVAVVVMALVNALIRPIARLLTAPLNCLTFGIIGVLVNALMFWLVPLILDAVNLSVFSITSFWGALAGSFLVGALSAALNNLIIRDSEKD